MVLWVSGRLVGTISMMIPDTEMFVCPPILRTQSVMEAGLILLTYNGWHDLNCT